MEPPPNIDQPFFAYGLFKPGQLAFFQVREFVKKIRSEAFVSGMLLLRDGLPLFEPSDRGRVWGAVLTFRPEQAGEAYERIAEMEPKRQYRWHETKVDELTVNVLVGRSLSKGSDYSEFDDWNGWHDPHFREALEIVEETIETEDCNLNSKQFFKLQMAYMLLWTSIERYASLRYNLGDSVMEKVLNLAEDPTFCDSLQRNVEDSRAVYRADRPDAKEVLDPSSPLKALKYYYQIRSNIVHRGKSLWRDYDRVSKSTKELVEIFREVLAAAEQDASREMTDASQVNP
jgi:hypothetical protein